MKSPARARSAADLCRSAAVLTAFVLALGLARSARAETTTFVQGRLTSDTGSRAAGSVLSLVSGAPGLTTTAPGGLFVLDGLFSGTRDRLRVAGGSLAGFVGPTFYAGATPRLGDELSPVESVSLLAWMTAVDSDGTFEATEGIVFGAVRDAAGAPVTRATVTIDPPDGDIFYFNEAGVPDPAATATPASGRFLILNVPPGLISVTALTGGAPAGVVYGEAIADVVSGLSPTPPSTVGGLALNETGGTVSSALIEWDFDPAVATMTAGDGSYSLGGLARGLDATLRGTAPGFKGALTFRRSLDELGGASAADVGFLSEANYAAYPARFQIVQAPSLGMILGRVLTARDANGVRAPLAGATVTVDPAVGIVKYLDSGGNPCPIPTQTCASGRFIVLNVPPGTVALSAVGSGQTIHSEVAPSVAGEVTQGDLRGLPTITVKGRIRDELSRTSTISGAVVSLAEYPYIATLASPVGEFTLRQVPAGELLTFKVSRADFKDSYSFIERSPDSDLNCDSTLDRADCKDLFGISNLGSADVFSQAGLAANRSLGLVAAGVLLSNGNGPIGFTGQLTPQSVTPRYQNDGRLGTSFITTVGSLQLLNAAPSVAGLVLSDPRTDAAQVSLLRIAPDSASLTSGIRLACDTDADGTLTGIYPCNGAAVSDAARDLFFQWRKGTGGIKFQVQIATDPSFAHIAVSSASKGRKFLRQEFWQATTNVLKKIRKLRPAGTGADFFVYWRILAQDGDKHETTSAPFVFILP